MTSDELGNIKWWCRELVELLKASETEVEFDYDDLELTVGYMSKLIEGYESLEKDYEEAHNDAMYMSEF